MSNSVYLLDCASRIEEAPSVEALTDALLIAATSFGLTGVALLEVHLVGRSRRAKILLNTFPEAFSTEYVQTGAIEHDPHVAKAMRTWKAFRWIDPNDEALCPKGRAVIEIGVRHGLTAGLCGGVPVPSGARAVLIMGGERIDVTPRDLTTYPLLALCTRSRLGELAQAARSVAPRLSRREADCLRWAAKGKTSWEIAQILEISQHTADWYLNTAARKLKATNRIQAVAEAFRHGLIA